MDISMSYMPVGGYALQTMTQQGEVANGYYLKFYEANTTTPLSMATDSTGATTLVKAKLNDNGMPISNPLDNTTVFVPFVNQDYRLVIYTNETDADNNTTASAFVNIPSIPVDPPLLQENNLSDLNSVPTARNNLGIFSGNKNLIINGDFSIWQRGDSQTTSGYGSDDVWSNNHSGSTKTHTKRTFSLGQTDVPGSPLYYSETVVGSSAGASNFVIKLHKLESLARFSGQEVTLSFWAKADAAKNIATEYEQYFGTGGSPSSTINEISVTTHSLTTSWQKFTATTTIPSLSGKTLGTDNNDTLILLFWLDAGSDYNDRTNTLGQQSGTFDICNVQLEFGDTATDFEYVSPADQLARCQRFGFDAFGETSQANSHFGWGYAASTTNVRMNIDCPVTMRAVPTSISISGNIAAVGTTSQAITNVAIVSTVTNLNNVGVDCTVVGATASEFKFGRKNSDASATMFISAEL